MFTAVGFEPDALQTQEESLTEEEEEFIRQRFEQRFQRLQEACQRHNRTKTSKRFLIKLTTMTYLNPEGNLTVEYCPIQKTASTTWRHILKKLEAIEIFPPPEVPQSDKISFAFVREPYMRLLSAYTDKLFSPNPMFWNAFGKFIVRFHRDDPTPESELCGHDVTFAEFIKYVIQSQKTGINRDGHFIPLHDHCNWCHVQYKYIGHLETISQDMPYLLKLLKIQGNDNTDFDKATIINNSQMVFNHYITGITKCITLEEACRRLWKKWHIRGIISKTEDFPLSELRQDGNITLERFETLAFEALARSGNKSERMLQKKEAMREAYGSVPFLDILKLQKILFLDFEMFGFDPEPEEIFGKSSHASYDDDASYLPLNLNTGEDSLFTVTKNTLRTSNTGEQPTDSSLLTRTQEQVRERFETRRRVLESACRLHRNSSRFRKIRSSLQYIEPLQTYYCLIPKCSSTTWKRLLRSIRIHFGVRRSSIEAPKKTMLKLDENAHVFVFVRDPYSRLLSAYVDKLFGPNPLFWNRTGTYIVAHFRPNASSESLRCGHDVTFAEFIKYVIHAQAKRRIRRNVHFIPAHDQCRFCEYPYKYVGHLETLEEDMKLILAAIKSPVPYSYNDFDRITLMNNSNTALSVMRSGIEDCVTLEEAARRLWKKWHIRGIISKTEPFPLSAEQLNNFDLQYFQNESLKALCRSKKQETRRLQKTEAMREAYSSVPLEDRLRLQELLFLDFELFGYDSAPRDVFVEDTDKNIGYSYFSHND